MDFQKINENQAIRQSISLNFSIIQAFAQKLMKQIYTAKILYQ